MLRTTTFIRARRATALLLVFATAGCGGGGALLPTEPGTGGGSGEPIDPGTGNNGGGGGAAPVTVTVMVSAGEDGGFSPQTVTVPVGSTVVWQMVDDDHDITFDGNAPAGGDIPETDEDESASRTFDQAGTYTYHCEEDADDDEDAHAGVVIVTEGGGGDPTEPTEPTDPTDPGVPSSATVRTVGDSFSPPTVTVGTGGTVNWLISGDEHNVTFTGAAPPGGNIPDTEGATVSRSFPTAGRYNYFCTRHSGMTGAVVVE